MSTKLYKAIIDLQAETKGLSLLYVEDDLDIQEEYFYFLQRFFQNITRCSNGEDGLQEVEKRAYDLVISDIEMPRMDGIAMIEKIKQLYPNQKTIIISAHKTSQTLHKAIMLQVDGYLFKPLERLHTIELLFKVCKIIQIEKQNYQYKMNLEKIIEEKTKELISSFTIDKTTNFYTLAKYHQENLTLSKSFSILKIRKFKNINDFYGYTVGDSLLLQTADLLRKELQDKYIKENIQIYRVSGSHFVITSTIKPEKMLTQIEEFITLYEKTKINIGVDKLILEMDGAVLEHGISPSLSNLDKALRKSEANNSTILYKQDIKEEIGYKKRIEYKKHLINACKENRLINYYQPIVDNQSQKILKYEALVRLITKEGKVITPNYFLPIAKETKIYSTITKKVIENAFNDFKDSECVVSINLSLEDIKNQDVREYIRINLKNFKEPWRVVFEILESEEVDSYAIIEEFIEEIRKYGAKIAIDDFGSGYSNFENLAKLNIDYLKIDGSLIDNIDTNKSSQAIVQMLYDFAVKMDIKTIAEFVSREEINSYVKSIGIDESQGYYYSKPKPFEISMKKVTKVD